jgi:general secretion pathway protein I
VEINKSANNSELGFTLIEVIVSLVLIASVGMALYSWINSSLGSLNRVKENTFHQEVTRNAMSFMQTINPMTQPSGESDVGFYNISWQSQLVGPPKVGSGLLGGTSLYELALYDTSVHVAFRQEEITAFDMRLVGYRQIKEFTFEL